MSHLSPMSRLHRLIFPSMGSGITTRPRVGRWFGGLMTAGVAAAVGLAVGAVAWSGPAVTTGATPPVPGATTPTLQTPGALNAAPGKEVNRQVTPTTKVAENRRAADGGETGETGEGVVAPLGFVPLDVRESPEVASPAASATGGLGGEDVWERLSGVNVSAWVAPLIAIGPMVEGLSAAQPVETIPGVAAAAPEPVTIPRDVPTEPRVIYLVDASGSMLDSLPDAVKFVQRDLSALRSPTRFQMIFFHADEVVDAPLGLQAATSRAKAGVWRWVEREGLSLQAAGGSDVRQALRSALALGATRVVILSDDKFNRRSSWGVGVELIPSIREELDGRDVTIDTVEFYYRGRSGALEAVADAFGGEYVFVDTPQRERVARASLLDLP